MQLGLLVFIHEDGAHLLCTFNCLYLMLIEVYILTGLTSFLMGHLMSFAIKLNSCYLDFSSLFYILFMYRFLHEVCSPSCIHKNIKSSNILLDTELNPHLSDCGLSNFYEVCKSLETVN